MIQDRDRAFEFAMATLFVTEESKVGLCGTAADFARLYIDIEAFRAAQDHEADYPTVSKHALRELCRMLHHDVDETVLEDAVEVIVNPPVYPDVQKSLAELLSEGYDLAFLTHHSKSMILVILEVLLPGFDHSRVHVITSSYRDLCLRLSTPLEKLSKVVEGRGLERSQVLLVTSNRFRGVEPAHALSIPSALLCRPESESLETAVSLSYQTLSPLISLTSLADLVKTLRSSSSRLEPGADVDPAEPEDSDDDDIKQASIQDGQLL